MEQWLRLWLMLEQNKRQQYYDANISFFLNGYLSSFSSMSYFGGRVNFVKLIDQLHDKY